MVTLRLLCAPVFPLHLIGWEPMPTLPSTYGLDEDILANGLVGSMISDYFWSVHYNTQYNSTVCCVQSTLQT